MGANKNRPFYVKPFNIVIFLIFLVGAYYFLPQLNEFRNSLSLIRHASWLWLAVGLVFSALTFAMAAITQFAAGNMEGKFYHVTLLQLGGSFVNHFVPLSLGSLSMTSQYYQDIGKKRSESISIAVLPTIFGLLTTIVIVACISPLTLSHLAQKYRLVQHSGLLTTIATIALVIGILAAPFYWRKVKGFLLEALSGIRALKSLMQIAWLLLGSVGISMSAALVLSAALLSIKASLSFIDVFIIYITSSVVGNFSPTPGGIGATEAVLAFSLSSVGLPLPQAVAATLIYRLLSFWLPIPFEFVALRVLHQELKLIQR